jgi:hypothetical protein
MAKVGGKLGFTLKINKNSQYEFIRPEISIDEIDTDGDVQAQLDLAEKALKITWNKVTDLAGEEILSEVGDLDQELQLQLKKKFAKIDVAIEELKAEVATKATAEKAKGKGK